MKTKLASSLALVVKIDKVSLYDFDSTHTNLLHFWKRKKEKKGFFEMCHTAKALWKRRPTNPMSGKFPYYFLQGVFFSSYQSLWVLRHSRKQMDYYSKREMIWSYGVRPIRGKIPQARPRWMAWSLAYVSIWHKNNSIKALEPPKTRHLFISLITM